jgi:hypothetical protein
VQIFIPACIAVSDFIGQGGASRVLRGLLELGKKARAKTIDKAFITPYIEKLRMGAGTVEAEDAHGGDNRPN